MNQSDHQGDNEWIYEYRIEMGIGILVISELFTNYDNNRAVSLRKIKLSRFYQFNTYISKNQYRRFEVYTNQMESLSFWCFYVITRPLYYRVLIPSSIVAIDAC